jgi:23S rRNA (guanine745-N1)-methyltransferase
MDSHIDGFALLSEKKLSYKIKLSSSEEIKNLFMMTPYAYKTSRADTERLLSHNELSVEAESIIFVYKKADGK